MQELNEDMNEFDAELLKDFQYLRRTADNFIKAHHLGYFDRDVLLHDLDKLREKDSMSVEWKPGYALDEWYKLEGDEWVASFPPFPRHLLTDPNEYRPESGRNEDLKWVHRIKISGSQGE